MITKDSTAEELCDILRKEGIDEGILEALKGEKGFNGEMVVGARVNDVVVELQNLGVFDHLPVAQFKTVTTNIAKILWEARDVSEEG